MQEKTCDLWLEPAEYRCILTSGAVDPSGAAVMDSRIAREAAQRIAGLDTDLGRLITSRGNHVHVIRPGILSFPIKQYHWSGPSLGVIGRSARELAALVGGAKTLLPRPGCEEGELPWEEVAKVLAFLPDNVVVVRRP